MKKAVLAIITLVICLSFTMDVQSQQAKIKVFVGVQGDESTIVESFIRRELRSIGDVQLVKTEKEGELNIFVNTMVTRLKDGHIAGYAIASVFTVNRYCLDNIYPVFVNTLIQTGSREQLQELSKSMVARFDTSCLEPWRQ